MSGPGPRGVRCRGARAILALALLGVLAARPGPADTARVYVIEPSRSQLRFHATSRLMDADGTFRRFGGEVRFDTRSPETASARLTVEVASLDTGITRRDNHLRSEDFFDVARHPAASFVSSSVRPGGDRFLVEGQLTIRGVTQRLSVPVAVMASANGLRIVAEFTLSRRAFGVTYSSFLNPIGDEVRVMADLAATPR